MVFKLWSRYDFVTDRQTPGGKICLPTLMGGRDIMNGYVENLPNIKIQNIAAKIIYSFRFTLDI